MSNRHEFVIAAQLPPTTEHIIHGYNNGGQFLAYEVFDVSGDDPEMQAANGFRDQQKAAFMAGEITNPTLNYCPDFHQGSDERRQLFLQTQALMYTQQLRYDSGQSQTLEDRLLDRMIAFRINEIGYVETARLVAQGNVTDNEHAALGGVLKEAGRSIYGMPDKNRALSLIATRHDKAAHIADDSSHPLHDVAAEVLSRMAMPDFDRQPEKVHMEDGAISYYSGLLSEEVQDAIDFAFSEHEPKDTYSTDEMQDIFNRYLEKRGFAEAGWKAAVIANRTACAAKANEQLIEIGDKRSAARRTYKKVVESMVHEAEHHAGRQVRGRNLGSGLAEFGLANYIEFEEPFATTDTSIYLGSLSTSGVLPNIALAIAAGYDGQERDFRDSYELMWRLAVVNSYKKDVPLEDQMIKAQNSAYANLVRVWRGMPTDIAGCVFPKDRAYDNTAVVSYLNNNGDLLPRQDFLRLLQAKYNPMDPDQDAYIRSLTD